MPEVTVTATRADGDASWPSTRACASTPPTEAEYYRHGGVLNYVLRQLAR